MKKVKVEDALGMVLGHDLTKIVPNEFKGAAFKKGHIISKEDIEVLKDMGKYHIYVIDMKEDLIHEEEAAIRIGKVVTGGCDVCRYPICPFSKQVKKWYFINYLI